MAKESEAKAAARATKKRLAAYKAHKTHMEKSYEVCLEGQRPQAVRRTHAQLQEGQLALGSPLCVGSG